MRRQWLRYTLGASCLLIAAQFSACKSDPGGSPIITNGGAPATGTGTAGLAAPPAGTGGGAVAGVGAAAGVGSGVAGVGAAGVGAAAGTGAAMAGTGAAGGGSTANWDSCANADKTTPGPMLRTKASSAIITMMGTCAFSSCHDMSAHKAKLILDTTAGTDLNMLTVGKPSCESPNLKLVDAAGGDQGLAKSWLWQKLTAPAAADGTMTAKPEWGTAVNCGQASGQAFGLRMPWMSTADLLKPTSKLTDIQNWICAGAP
jgi:hypothetical protein